MASNTTFDQLNDDILIDIFTRLGVLDKLRVPSICKRWRVIAQAYEDLLFKDCLSLGTIVDSSCTSSNHFVYQKDTIFPIFCPNSRLHLTQDSTTTLFKGKLIVDDHKLSKILSKLPNLQSLILKYCSQITETTIETILTLCPNLVHLDLSASRLNDGLNVLKALGSIDTSSNLVHLNLLACDGVDESELAYLFTKLIQLQELTLGRNDPNLSGFCLAHLQSNIKKVALHGIDRFTNNGTRALLYLSSGHGRNIEWLKIKGELNVSLIQMIPNHFPFLNTVEAGDFFTDLWIDATHQLIGQALSRLTGLKSLILTLPELIQFDGNIFEIARNCSTLRCLELRGGPISDVTVEYLTNSCLNLEKLCLSYSQQFHGAKSGPSDQGLLNICRLTHLTCLILNGTQITDSCLIEILTSCPRLNYIDIRDNTGITDITMAVLIESSSLRPHQPIDVFINGTGIDSTQRFHLIAPANLRISTSARVQDDEVDGEYDDEEFEVEQISPEFGVIYSNAASLKPIQRIDLFQECEDSSSSEDD